MSGKPSRRKLARTSLEGSERARIAAAFMGLLVEQSIKKIGSGRIAAAADASPAQLREELGSTIAILAAQVEKMDRLVFAGEEVEGAERSLRLAVLLTSVLRTWLDGEDPDFARAVSALDRAAAWAAPPASTTPGQAMRSGAPLVVLDLSWP
jgi:hypothetical protein